MMTVADLIKQLQALPQNLPIVTYSWNGEGFAYERLVLPAQVALFHRHPIDNDPLALRYGPPQLKDVAAGAGPEFEAVAIGIEA